MRTFLFHFAVLVVLFTAVFTLSSCGPTIVIGAPGEGLGSGGPITVRGTPQISWTTPVAITSPEPLGAAQLDATASVPGTFVYTPAAGTVLAAGMQMLSVTFTPTDTVDYNTVTASVSITVNPAPIVKTTPTIAWAQPAAITNPEPLSGTQLDATASVPGTFVYTPPLGTVLAAGTQTLSVTFTPTDMTDYNTATASVMFTVNLAPVNTTSLAVSDAGNGRVLIYSTPFTTGESASVAIGQKDLVSSGYRPTAADTFASADGMAMDASGNLYVADIGNCRVLQFQPPFTTGMSASLVIGQPGFTSCVTSGFTTNANQLMSPHSVAVDRQGDLWVTDSWYGRITEYVPPFTSGMAATLVIGKTSFTDPYACNTTNAGPAPSTASTLCEPGDARFDVNGNLWVADSSYSRLLEFIPPFSTGMSASLEIGQPAATPFTSYGNSYDYGISASSLYAPAAIAFDPSGNLWVADYGDSRVVEFVPPFSNGMAASLVLGQSDFTHGLLSQGGIPAANTLLFPTGLSFDSSGNLIVQDTSNNRALIFTPPFTNGMNAAIVLGQPNFTTNFPNQFNSVPVGPNTLFSPTASVTF